MALNGEPDPFHRDLGLVGHLNSDADGVDWIFAPTIDITSYLTSDPTLMNGGARSEAYAALLGDLVQSEAPQSEVVELCRRGLIVSLRDERPELAKTFADKLASAGDRAGLDLLKMGKSSESSSFELLGAVDEVSTHLISSSSVVERTSLTVYLSTIPALSRRRLLSPAITSGAKEWLSFGTRVHEYFQILRALAALGERKQGRIEISLTLTNKAGKQRTGKVFGILGLKLKSNKERVTVKSAEGKSEVKKQDTLAALAIDDGAIQQALASGETYRLGIPIDSVPVFPSVEYWQRQFTVEQYKGGLAEALFADPRIARLFYAINSMDRATAKILVQSVPPQVLAERYSSALWLYAAALAINGTAAEAPGGPSAIPTWERFTGVSPRNPVPFFEALLDKDDGRLIAFFYSLSQLDFQHQQFFTRSPERLERFYDLFRDSPEMHRGGERRIGGGSFLEFLREVPLNPDLSVDFPGSAEVWMIAKVRSATTSSVAKMNRKVKRAVAPDSEDEILVRLATSAYKSLDGKQSELANFIATVHIDKQRTEPLSPEAALLLAQGYASYGGLYPYFAELGDLDVSDYQKLFTLADRFNAFDIPTANLRLGEVHSFLAMVALLHERGSVPEKDMLSVYRTGIDRFIAATDAVAWTVASLTAVDDLARLASPKVSSRDSAIEALLIGNSASVQGRDMFAQVLTVQKAPSLDALCTIWSDASNSVAEGSEFRWFRSRILGGRTNHYARMTFRFSDYDFKPYDRDGMGTNWPISYDDISPYYDKMERFVGVVGSNENLRSAPNGIFQDPPPPKAHEVLIKKACDRLGILCIPNRRAVLTKSLNGRPPCHYCGQCVRGCVNASNYSSSQVQIFPAIKTGKLTVINNAMVREVVTNGNGRATGVIFIDKQTRAERLLRGRLIVVAASSCESARILLNSKSKEFPNGLANESGLYMRA
ncbi:MAG TPA: GMC family oxidoreductase N-terminal domain-containing protein [Bryobacteraceae bacterium]|jgi:hypothetical protein|nr:GMC family oxidoreductase N-terminal domain-containing protein [Bryobacteraceae bacterium]